MALIPTDDCKRNNQSTTNGRIGARKTGFQGRSGSLKSVRMQPKESDYSTDGLPKAFLLSLRTLFDILDDGRRGFVHISEIEGRWQGADTQDLPGGVLECLRRAAPPHGCLTFQRFVAGLRYSMLNPDNNNDHFKAEAALQTAKPYPNHNFPPPLTKSASHSTCNVGTRIDNKPRPLGPSNVANTQQKPRATPLHDRVRPEDGRRYPSCGTARYDAGCERSGRCLERVSVVPVQYIGKQGLQPGRVRAIDLLALESSQFLRSTTCAVEAGLQRSRSESAKGLRAGSMRHQRSREEQRRHTITNGVDYGMLKQMKELEQEKDSLLAGLEQVERARDWYQTQIHSVTERQQLVGQSDHCMEGSPSHINVLIPKLQEVNRCLNDLIACTEGNQFHPPGVQNSTYPPSPNPSCNHPSSTQAPPQAIQRLKEQNRLLTQEVTEKSDRITKLEQEKSALIKQLFEARAHRAHDTSTMDSTFI
ncbi:unnamed protein product [Arctogadus glacialis]